MWCEDKLAGSAAPEWRCVARGGLPAGSASRAFAPAELAAALHLLDTSPPRTVYVEQAGGGGWRVAGAGRGGGGALAAAAARTAPHPPARTAALVLAPAADGSAPDERGWRLVLAAARALAPHEELVVWPDAALLALAGVAPLPPASIRGGAEYRCVSCGETYEQPNPLKMHVYLGCEPARAPAFLRRVLAALVRLPPPAAPAPAAAPGHACAYCGRVYSRRYGLKIHMRTHTGERPLRCAHCARRFADPSNLNKHRRLHLAHSHIPARAHTTAHSAITGG